MDTISFHDSERANKSIYCKRLEELLLLPKVQINCIICQSNESNLLASKDGLKVVVCSNCGHIYVNPRFTEDVVKKIYDVSYWMEFQPSIGSPNIIERVKFDYINGYAKLKRDILPHVQSGRFLDIGCSNGALVKCASEYGFVALGLEVSESVARIGRQIFQVEIRSGTLKENNFSSSFFDVVALYDVLEHLFDPREELAEIVRILRPKGVLVIETLNADSLNFRKDPLLWECLEPIEHVHYFNQKNLISLLRSYGLKIIECRCPHEDNIVICCRK